MSRKLRTSVVVLLGTVATLLVAVSIAWLKLDDPMKQTRGYVPPPKSVRVDVQVVLPGYGRGGFPMQMRARDPIPTLREVREAATSKYREYGNKELARRILLPSAKIVFRHPSGEVVRYGPWERFER